MPRGTLKAVRAKDPASHAAGTKTILATPHINDDASIDPPRIAAGLEALRDHGTHRFLGQRQSGHAAATAGAM